MAGFRLRDGGSHGLFAGALCHVAQSLSLGTSGSQSHAAAILRPSCPLLAGSESYQLQQAWLLRETVGVFVQEWSQPPALESPGGSFKIHIPGSRTRVSGAEAALSEDSDAPPSVRSLLPRSGGVPLHSNGGGPHWVALGVRDWAVTSAAGPSASMLPWVAGHLVSFLSKVIFT